MANYNIVSANVKASAKAGKKPAQGICGETIVPGNVLNLDTASGAHRLADADNLIRSEVSGIALTGGAAGQPLLFVKEDEEFDLGVTIGSGATVVLSTTPGAMCPDADLGSGARKVVLGIGTGGTKFKFAPITGGVL